MSDIIKLHRYSSCNRTLLQASDQCGCFYCLVIFTPDQIRDYLDDSGKSGGSNDSEKSGASDPNQDGSDTALCPYCHIDAVLPDGKLGDIEVVITLELLTEMEKYWFKSKDDVDE